MVLINCAGLGIRITMLLSIMTTSIGLLSPETLPQFLLPALLLKFQFFSLYTYYRATICCSGFYKIVFAIVFFSVYPTIFRFLLLFMNNCTFTLLVPQEILLERCYCLKNPTKILFNNNMTLNCLLLTSYITLYTIYFNFTSLIELRNMSIFSLQILCGFVEPRSGILVLLFVVHRMH